MNRPGKRVSAEKGKLTRSGGNYTAFLLTDIHERNLRLREFANLTVLAIFYRVINTKKP